MSTTDGDSGAVRPTVEVVAAVELHAIRRLVLRDGTPSDEVSFVGDDDAQTIHLAIRDTAGTVIAVATWAHQESPEVPGEPALQLRGMAVHPDHQRRGLGAVLLSAGDDLGRERGIAWLWANARDSAMAFYRAGGYEVVGEPFRTQATGLPHHRILRRL